MVAQGFGPDRIRLTGRLIRTQDETARRDRVNSRRYLRRSLVSSLLLRLLVLALVYLTLLLIEPATPEDEVSDAPAPTAAPSRPTWPAAATGASRSPASRPAPTAPLPCCR